jgi:hypothetical protein
VTTAPDQRFAQLKHADPKLGEVTTTFLSAPASLAAPAGQAPRAAAHPALAGIAADDPQRAARIQAGMHQLIARNDTVMSWLGADPANAALFASDPVAGLREALPDLPPDFFDGWT